MLISKINDYIEYFHNYSGSESYSLGGGIKLICDDCFKELRSDYNPRYNLSFISDGTTRNKFLRLSVTGRYMFKWSAYKGWYLTVKNLELYFAVACIKGNVPYVDCAFFNSLNVKDIYFRAYATPRSDFSLDITKIKSFRAYMYDMNHNYYVFLRDLCCPFDSFMHFGEIKELLGGK